ncbi:cytochrome P450, partial [Hypoxylon rubiginosum]
MAQSDDLTLTEYSIKSADGTLFSIWRIADRSNTSTCSPAVVYAHGGGFVLRPIDMKKVDLKRFRVKQMGKGWLRVYGKWRQAQSAIEAKVVTVLSPTVLSTEVWPFAIWNAVSLFLFQYFAVKYYRIWVYPIYFSPLRHLPGPTDNHFFFGQALHLLWAETPTSLYIRWMRENPDAPVIWYFSFANTEVLVVNSIQAHKALLQTHCYDFRKPDTLRHMVKEIVGNGIFMLEGEIHRARRKMLAASFSNPHIRKHQPIFQRVARQLGGVFDQAIDCNTRDAVGMVDCRKAFCRATLDIIAETALGIEL